jgi:hypothetical protein
MLLNMASTWESLAEERIKSAARQERIANLETIARMKSGSSLSRAVPLPRR